MEAKRGFFKKVYFVVKKIPLGKVATYGQIADLVNSKWRMASGKRINGRVVGFALHVNRDPQIPCHRVVNKEGRLATTFGMGGWQEQKRRLQAEGVKFVDERDVDLERHLWKQGVDKGRDLRGGKGD